MAADCHSSSRLLPTRSPIVSTSTSPPPPCRPDSHGTSVLPPSSPLRSPTPLTSNSFNQQVLIDTTPLPDSIPKVEEIGASSAPLLSASFFIGARCKPYNDDFMHCKTESNGKGESDCLKEGRKVTRCAASVLDDLNKSCLEEFRKHWQCLDHNNQQLWQCRGLERRLNKCAFEKL